MKQEGLKERMELLEIGEKLGWPRLGYGRPTKIPHDKRIPPGQVEWEKFAAHAHVRRIYPALRVGRVLRDNEVEVYHPISSREAAPAFVDGDAFRLISKTDTTTGETTLLGTDLLDDIIQSPAIVPVDPAPRRKRGGHKRPPHPKSKRNRSTAS